MTGGPSQDPTGDTPNPNAAEWRAAPPLERGRPPRRRQAGRWIGLSVAVLLVLGIAVAAAGLRYLPLVGDVRAVRDTAGRLATQARALGPGDLQRDSMAGLRARLAELDGQLAPIRSVMRDDPIVAIARALPIVGAQVGAADHLVAAADSLLEAGGLGLDLADEVVALREEDAADPSSPLLPDLVELMASSTAEVDRIGELVDEAGRHLEAIPDGSIDQVREARDLVRAPLLDYGPLLDGYRELDDVVPGMLGWGGQKRYLILAQNPAELRPAGGHAGTIGMITLRDGAVVEQLFRDVYDLDLKPGLPYVEPPSELVDHLLGKGQAWRLADAAWAADFSTGAQKALELYQIEAGETDIDGVIGITTFALDRLLEVIGPVKVPAYGVTVQPGDVTLTLLGVTRGTPTSIEGRKDVLDALARQTMQRLLASPPERWASMVEAIDEIGAQRMAVAWFEDAAAQELARRSGWAGVVRQEPGDYVYVVESNMAPTSKYNLVVDRAASLVVKLTPDGDALDSLRLDWQNHAGKPGEPYRSLREFSENKEGLYGAYVRVLVPDGSAIVTASGSASDPIRGVQTIAEEAGRDVFGNFLLMPPGEATMSYLWTAPDVARQLADGTWEYRLVVQKQPGARPGPLSIRIDLPEGAEVLAVTEGGQHSDGRIHYETSLIEDVEVVVRYASPADA